MSGAICRLLRTPTRTSLLPDWKNAQGQFNQSPPNSAPSRGFIATQIVCGGGPKQKDGPIWGRSLRKLGLMDKWKEAKKERIKVAIERQKLERERRAIRRELQLAMEERRRAEHERKLAELARLGIIENQGQDDNARKADLLSALRTGQTVKEPWQEGLEKITMKDIQETFETPINLEALRDAGVFDESGVLGPERGSDRRVTPEQPGDNDWGLRPAPREDQVSLEDLREMFQGGSTGAEPAPREDQVSLEELRGMFSTEESTSGRGVLRIKSEVEQESEEREKEIARLEGITVSDEESGFEDSWSEDELDMDTGRVDMNEAAALASGSDEEAFVVSNENEEETAPVRAGLKGGLRVENEEGEEDTWQDEDFDVLRERPAAAYEYAWRDIIEEGPEADKVSTREDGTVVNPYSGWVRVYTTPKKTKKGKIVPLEKRGNSTARIKWLLETARERQEGEADVSEQREEQEQALQAL